MFQSYAPLDGVYDEFLDPRGETRLHAQNFVDEINRLGRDELSIRWSQARRLVDANGFAYSGFVGPRDKARPWELDALPVIIDAPEWASVSAALQQRALLLDLVLQDLYGEQTLLKNGALPPELVFSHPGFLRAFHRRERRPNAMLQFYAADLARSPDGKWWVLADRTESPSGLGFALENRIVISRMLPEVYQACQVQRLAPFFIAAQEALRALAPRHRQNPRAVLLSDGPGRPNYFEDAYFARYMGYDLVEGGDLAVRNSQVMLKTLGGLLPVDVILRRKNSAECDPLEFEGTTNSGVAGLAQAARAKNVGIVNALGSGLVESVGFMAYIPRLCRTLLSEDLLMPGVASWWCGEPESLQHVLANLDSLTVQPAFRQRGRDVNTRQQLSRMSRTDLTAAIRANPPWFAAQEKVVRSSTPIWKDDLKAARLALRGYVVRAGESYTVMQGALARISSSLDPLDLSIRKGEGSKDVWVLSHGPVEDVSLLEEPGQTISLRRSGNELPSRSADNLFWLGRQLERAESLARLLRCTASRLIGETRSTSELEIPVLLRCLAEQGQIEPGYAVDAMRAQLPSIARVLPEVTFDAGNPSSLRAILDEMSRLGSTARDRMSQDTWRVIRRIDERFRPARARFTSLSELLALTDDLIIGLVAFSGIVTESMTRTQAFRFLELGRRLERALQVISLVQNTLVPLGEVSRPIFETVLEVADSLMTYRSRYLASFQLSAVLDLLLTDETNPRSLAYQCVQLAEHVEQLPRDSTQPGYSLEQRTAMALVHSIRLLDIQAVAETHSLGEYEPLERLIQNWELQLPRLSEAISHRYLVHAGPARQLTDIIPQ